MNSAKKTAAFFLGAFLTVLIIPLAAENQMTGGRSMELRSSAFRSGADIPRKHTCDGTDLSPPLMWENVPSATKSFALIADDPDAPVGTWVHWVIYDLPARSSELQEGMPAAESLSGGAKQGVNDFRKVGYGGPCPPPGRAHHYFFKLYALDVESLLKPRATKQRLLDAMKGHILAEAQLMGRYGR